MLVWKEFIHQTGSLSIKNSLEFVNAVHNLQLEDGESLAFFDVCSLFLSIPMPNTLRHLENLFEIHNIDNDRIFKYLKLSKLCMFQNWFQIKDKFYKEEHRIAMSNSPSPFIAKFIHERFWNYTERKSPSISQKYM